MFSSTLFFVKLICVGVLIVSHYSLYLKFKNANLTLEEDPRNEILSDFKSLRRLFITKIFIIWIAGFIIIFVELILLGLVMTVSRIYIEEAEIKSSTEKGKKYDKPNGSIIIESQEVKIDLQQQVIEDKTNKEKRNKPNKVIILPSVSQPLNPSDVSISNPYRRDI